MLLKWHLTAVSENIDQRKRENDEERIRIVVDNPLESSFNDSFSIWFA